MLSCKVCGWRLVVHVDSVPVNCEGGGWMHLLHHFKLPRPHPSILPHLKLFNPLPRLHPSTLPHICTFSTHYRVRTLPRCPTSAPFQPTTASAPFHTATSAPFQPTTTAIGVVVADGEEVCFDAMATCSWSSFPSIRATSCRTHSLVTGDVGASEMMSENHNIAQHRVEIERQLNIKPTLRCKCEYTYTYY